jgi:ribonuclease HI
VAEYRALILGMKHAVMKGFEHVTVKGDSEYVINQVCYIIEYAFSLLNLKNAFEGC